MTIVTFINWRANVLRGLDSKGVIGAPSRARSPIILVIKVEVVLS
jgi:hypothetical protein